jgi:hypothetical protein
MLAPELLFSVILAFIDSSLSSDETQTNNMRDWLLCQFILSPKTQRKCNIDRFQTRSRWAEFLNRLWSRHNCLYPDYVMGFVWICIMACTRHAPLRNGLHLDLHYVHVGLQNGLVDLHNGHVHFRRMGLVDYRSWKTQLSLRRDSSLHPKLLGVNCSFKCMQPAQRHIY